MNQIISKHRISEERKEKIPHSAINVYLSKEDDRVFLKLEVSNLLDIANQYYKDLGELEDSNVILRFKPRNGSFIKTIGSQNLGNVFEFAKNPVADIEIANIETLEHLQLDLSITRQSDKFKLMYVENLRIKGFSKKDETYGSSSFIQGRIDSDLKVLYKTVVNSSDMPCVYFSDDEKLNGKAMMEDYTFASMIANELFYKMTKAIVDCDTENGSLDERSSWMKMWWNCLKQADSKECLSYEIIIEDNLDTMNSADAKSEFVEKITLKYREFLKSDIGVYANWIKMQDVNE